MQVAVTHEGSTLTSTTDTEAEIQAALGVVPPASGAPPESPAGDPASPEAPDEDLTADAATGDQAASEAGKVLGERRRSAQARINEITAKHREAERRARVAEARLAALSTIPAATPPPQEKDFSDYDLLDDAKRKHAAEEVYRKHELAKHEAATRAGAEAEQAITVSAYQERLAAVVATTPDFEATVNQPIDISPEMRVSIFESEVGPQLAYFFGKHPDEAARICSLRGTAALREIGRIEARLDAASHGPAPRATLAAPPPIKPLGGGATSASRLPLDHPDVSQAEYNRRRDAGER